MPRRPFTDEEKARIAAATRAAMQRPDIQAKLRRPRPNAALAKLGARNPMYGTKRSQETRAKARASMAGRHVGEENPAYKGEAAGLEALHAWVQRRMPLTGICSRCGQQKWTERAFLHWPAAYTRNPDDYAEMCRRCHMQFDRESGQRP